MDNAKVYELLDWEKLDLSKLKSKIDHLLNIIPSDVNSIIDIGCGNGTITNVLAEKYDTTGVDRSQNALKFVRGKKIEASCDSVPKENNSYDLVFSSELLEHLPEGVFQKTIEEFKRLSKKYILITVPNGENPNKLMIKCPDCGYIFNRPNHLRSFNLEDFKRLFPGYSIEHHSTIGKKVRYYIPFIQRLKRDITPSSSWIPYYWITKESRDTFCPKCEHSFHYGYKFHPVATSLDILNVILSPKKPYWLVVLLKKD